MGCFYVVMAQTTDLDKIKRDVKFVKCADAYGKKEVELSQLALANASNTQVKTHAQHMIDNHSKAYEELKTLSSKKGIVLPVSLSKMDQKKYDKLAKLKGEEFDKKFSKCMLKDHEKVVYIFKKEAEKGKDPDIKAWAAGKVSTMESHLDMWKETCKMLNK